MFSTSFCGDTKEPQTRSVSGLIFGRKVGVVVDSGVDETQRDKSPVHGVLPLRLHLANPLTRHPGERAYRVEIEVEIGVHATTLDQSSVLGSSRKIETRCLTLST